MNKPTYENLEAQVKQLTEASQQLRDESLKSTSAIYDVVVENVCMDSFVEAMLAIAWQGGLPMVQTFKY